MEKGWEKPEVQGLGEDRLRLIREAAEKSKGKEGMERLDVFLEYGEKLAAEGGSLPKEEQKTLLAAVASTLSLEEQERLSQMMSMMGY